MASYPLQELAQHFFQDPRWTGVEELIRSFIDPLLDMKSLDTSKGSEDVKAQVIGRVLAHKQLDDFLNQVKILNHPKLPADAKSPFR